MRAGILRRLKVRRIVRSGGGGEPREGTPAAQSNALTTQERAKLATGDKTDQSDIGRGIAWRTVNSSWITALRWVPTYRQGNQSLAYGYIDMRTKKNAYRYGPGISQRSFNTWLVAASRGKYWWRYHTARWSPAVKLW